MNLLAYKTVELAHTNVPPARRPLAVAARPDCSEDKVWQRVEAALEMQLNRGGLPA